jgi:predicted acylesterase/phospholipase RssA
MATSGPRLAARNNGQTKTKVALAFQGGGFPAGATGAGVIRGLVEKGAFGAYDGAEGEPGRNYEIVGFSGTSAGALLAAVCWAHKLKAMAQPEQADEKKRNADLIKIVERQWLYYAFPNNFAWFPVWNAKVARALFGLDSHLREYPLFDQFRQMITNPWFHMLVREWERACLAAALHPDNDPLDATFREVNNVLGDRFVDEILSRWPSVPMTDFLFKPGGFYKTYMSWMPLVPQAYHWLRVATFMDLVSDNLRRFGYGDPIEELRKIAKDLEARGQPLPSLAMGAANIFKGTPTVFTEKDVCADGLGAIIASGSLDELNGWTLIASGHNKGTYLDGAWGEDPPLDELVTDPHKKDRPDQSREIRPDEIWLVEYFPKYRGGIPSTPLERAERRDELWQNSLVDHELQKVELQKVGIKVRRIPMLLDHEPKASVVNNPVVIQHMMGYGYASACYFMDNLDRLQAEEDAHREIWTQELLEALDVPTREKVEGFLGARAQERERPMLARGVSGSDLATAR